MIYVRGEFHDVECDAVLMMRIVSNLRQVNEKRSQVTKFRATENRYVVMWQRQKWVSEKQAQAVGLKRPSSVCVYILRVRRQ